jgi:hypothetical protein
LTKINKIKNFLAKLTTKRNGNRNKYKEGDNISREITTDSNEIQII